MRIVGKLSLLTTHLIC